MSMFERDYNEPSAQLRIILNPYNILENELDIHLQCFAAEDEGRTFDPTDRKIQKAREEGRVSKTAEIPSAIILLTVAALLWALGSYFLKNFESILSFYFLRLHSIESTGFESEIIGFSKYMIRILWPISVLVVIMAIMGNVIQFGWAPSLKPLSPDFSRIALRFDKWAEKIVSIRGLYTTSTSLVKLAVVTLIVGLNVFFYREKIVATGFYDFEAGALLGIRIVFMILIESGVFLLLLGIIDYWFQRVQFMNQLKMSYQDIKDEFKESEGDPDVKRRIQGRMQEFLNRNISREVSDSDVLVTNPTHFAVALKYDRNEMEAPLVKAKGEDTMALRMRQIAKDSDVPIIENKPLARALYADLNVGDEIPEKYYGAVVLIFQEIYKMKGEVV